MWLINIPNLSSIHSATIASAAGSRAMPVQLENSTIVDTNGWRRGIHPAKRLADCAINMYIFFFLCFKQISYMLNAVKINKRFLHTNATMPVLMVSYSPLFTNLKQGFDDPRVHFPYFF
jgi:hypothetical protein